MRPKPLIPTLIFAMRYVRLPLVSQANLPKEGGRTGKLRGRPSRSLHHTRDRGDGRGLNPPPDERGPAVAEYDDASSHGLDEL
jgi:hypothetical protein